MKMRRLISALLIALSILLTLLGWFSFGCSIETGGGFSGPFGVLELSQGRRAAAMAALELGYSQEAIKARALPRLVLGKPEGGSREAARALLDSVEDMPELWAVRADGELVGYVEEPSELYELLEEGLHSESDARTVFASLDAKLNVRRCFAPAWARPDAAACAARIKERGVSVINA